MYPNYEHEGKGKQRTYCPLRILLRVSRTRGEQNGMRQRQLEETIARPRASARGIVLGPLLTTGVVGEWRVSHSKAPVSQSMNPVVHPFPQKQRCGRSRRGRQSVGSKVCPTESAAMNSSVVYYQPGACSEPEVKGLQAVHLYGQAPEGCSRQSCWKRCLKHTRVS
jgi:hypothetical protein